MPTQKNFYDKFCYCFNGDEQVKLPARPIQINFVLSIENTCHYFL